jgi:hypothetical protein
MKLTNKQMSIVVDIIYNKAVETINSKFDEEKVKQEARDYINKCKPILKYTELFKSKYYFDYISIKRKTLSKYFPKCLNDVTNDRIDRYNSLSELI